MPTDVGWPYTVLGLDTPEPVRRDIRRAYAAQLKKIDQAKEQQAFEELRQAYEFALSNHDSHSMDLESPVDLEKFDWDQGAELFDEKEVSPALKARSPETFSAEAKSLLDRVSKRAKGEPDTTRLIEILADPLMSDPVVSEAIENEIYHFLHQKIDRDLSIYPSFNLSGTGGELGYASTLAGQRYLMDELDDKFGWLSDQIGMRRKFVGYDDFLEAALYAYPTRPNAADAIGFKLDLRTIVGVLVLGVWIIKSLFAAFEDNMPRRTIIGQTGPLQIDAEFLNGNSPTMKPSDGTMRFLENLAEEQGFSDKAVTDVNVLVARNWALRATDKSISRTSYGDYSNLEELKYMTGVLIAARYQFLLGLGYRHTNEFSLSWDPNTKSGKWRITAAGGSASSLWGEAGGYMLGNYQDMDAETFRVVYPAEFIGAVRAATGDDRRALEGALGLRAYTFDRRPYVRLFHFEDIEIPGDLTATLDLDHHHLVHTGIGENRWPFRVTTLPYEACQVTTFTPKGILGGTRC